MAALNSFAAELKGRPRHRAVWCPAGLGSGTDPVSLYTADLLQLIESHDLRPHLYADDTQIYGFCRPGDTARLQSRVSLCICEVALWMRADRLQLNAEKTEIIWCSSHRHQHQIPDPPLVVGTDAVMPVRSIRNLGIYTVSQKGATLCLAVTFVNLHRFKISFRCRNQN